MEKKNMIKNKKAFVQDWLFFGIMMLIIAVAFIFGSLFLSEINTKFQASDMPAISKDMMSENANRYPVVFDWAFFGIFLVFGLGIIVSMYVINTNPALFFPLVTIFAFILFILAIMGNVYEEYSTSDSMTATTANFIRLDWLMDNFVFVILVLGFIGLVALFAKYQ